MFTILVGIIERGLLFSLIVAGVYLTSRIIKFDDLTVEGSFGIGGSVIAACLTHNINFIIATALAIIAGGLCGIATGLLHTKLNMNNLISGIVVTTGLFSIILKLSSSNVSLADAYTIFSAVPESLASIKGLVVLVPIAFGLITLLRWFLKTEIGFLLYAVGDNPQMLTNLGKRTTRYIITALTLSNMLSALAGALFVQYVGYFSIWSSVGILVISLAGLILAQMISRQFGYALIVGAIVYQALIAATFELDISQEWNKLVTAVLIIVLIIIMSQVKRRQ